MVGKTILQYRILKEVGRGGMGVVYKAEDTRLNRIVAIKALAADLISDDRARTRFMREARAASAIEHPNICAVYDFHVEEDGVFLVMQYIEGKTLKKLIHGRPLSFDQLLDFSLGLADGLVEAHRRNVIHRDIKSSNIIVNERGQPKILDFGLAKLMEPTEVPAMSDLTQAGTPFGTASYMSPEQAMGQPADRRSDIFSLGVVMYEMATGHLPFKGRTSVDVMHQVIHTEAEPLASDIPVRMREIISKAMTKSSADRYQTADAFFNDLSKLARSHYSGSNAVPAGMSESLKASKPAAAGSGMLRRFKSWAQGRVGARGAREDTPAKDETSSSGALSSTGATDRSVSPWRSSDKKAIAILPFKNLSGLAESDFYSFSLADSVITELARLRHLIVRPSSYIAEYQNKDVDPREVGAKLAVDAVLFGGYLKAGDRFRVTPQLVDTESGEIVWSEKIDVDARDIMAVQDTISRQIVEELRVRISSSEQQGLERPTTASPEAYETYLKGRAMFVEFAAHTVNAPELDAAVEIFKRALELDPEFGLAHGALGVCYLNYVLKGLGGVEYYGLAKASFDQALAIDPGLIEPRVRLIYVDLFEGAIEVARREVRWLLRRAPNEPYVHSTAAYVYRLCGQYEAGLTQWDEFLNLSPKEVAFASYNKARILIYQREFEKAGEEIAKGLKSEPEHPLLITFDAAVDYLRGNPASGLKKISDVLAQNPGIQLCRMFKAAFHQAMGDTDKAFALVDEPLKAWARADQDGAYWLASLYGSAEDIDNAISWLEHAVSIGYVNYPWIAADPAWAQLRQNPRYQELVGRATQKATGAEPSTQP